MIHYITDLLWTPFVNVLKFGGAAYILTRGLLGTIVDLCDLGIRLLED